MKRINNIMTLVLLLSMNLLWSCSNDESTLSKAVLTTILLCGVFGLLEYFGYSVILISFSALPAYLPLVVALLLLWFLVGHAL